MSTTPVRVVLQGVHRVAFAPIHDGRWEFTPFPSCLKSVAAFLGRPLSYHYLLGASGAAFRFAWHAGRWNGGNVDIVVMSRDPLEPFVRGVRAAGCSERIVLNRSRSWEFDRSSGRAGFLEPRETDDREEVRRAITASIAAGVPVIALGVVGPPEACIITGYDDGGDTLIGWSMFQEHIDPTLDLVPGDSRAEHAPSGLEPDGSFRRRDWWRSLYGAVFLEKGPEPDPTAVFSATRAWIPVLARTKRTYEFHTGIAAMRAYRDRLLDDADYPRGDRDALGLRKMAHYDAMTMLAERSNAAAFIRDGAALPRFAGVASVLATVADRYERVGREMEAWWEIVGPIWSDEEAQVAAVGDPRVRRAFAERVDVAIRAEEEAVGLVERVLDVCGPGET